MHATIKSFLVICNITIKLRKSHVRLMLLVTQFLMKPDFAYPQSKRHCVPVGINKPQGYLHQAGIFLCIQRALVQRERERERWLCSSWPPLHGPAWMALFVSSVLFPKPLPPQSWWASQIHENIIHKNTIVWINCSEEKDVYLCSFVRCNSTL